TTLGATVSKTFAKALFSAWTTSLPCSAAAAGTVGAGTFSGVAARIDIALSAMTEIENGNKRIGLKLDSIEHATFKAARPRLATRGIRVAPLGQWYTIGRSISRI